MFQAGRSLSDFKGEPIIIAPEKKQVSFYLLIWFLGVLFTLIKGKWLNFMGLEFLDPDLLTIMIAYLFLFYGPAAACAFAFGQGLLIDVFSSGLQGLFAFLYLSIFGGIYIGCRFFNLQEAKGQALLVSLVVGLKRILFIIVLSVFSQGAIVSSSFIWKSGVSAIGTGLIAPFIFLLFDTLRSPFLKVASKSSPEQ